MDTLQGLRQAKEELKGKIPDSIQELFASIGIGTRTGTFAGTGGELESKLSAIPIIVGSSCVRIYLREAPQADVVLPSTYRGVPIGYVVIGEIRALSQ